MTENELVGHYAKARTHIVVSQLGPIFLLIVTIALLTLGLGQTSLAIRLAAAGILLASGILGALVQYSAANEAMGIAGDLEALAALGAPSALAARIIAFRPWLNVVRFVTPAIFALIYLALLIALFAAA